MTDNRTKTDISFGKLLSRFKHRGRATDKGYVMRTLRHCISRVAEIRGQMTVELCVVFPVAVAIAVIVVNAATFFSYCSEFDRVSRNAVRVIATCPEAKQTRADAASCIKNQIVGSIDASNISCTVSVKSDANGFETYKATLKYRATLFGLGMKSSIFGVRMPALTHTSTLTVDPYKPGELL